jgi:BirA family biotin operon repressor/biotin-[acetyl-CoA-carboxylase] ligase
MGYKLTKETDSPVPWELARILETSFVGRQVIYRDVAESTQSIAIAIADRQGSHGAVVIAEQQKSGRGRIKRKWLSPKGGIWMSVILQPKVPTARITTLPFVAALAVCKAIQEATKLEARLKWPNDVMIGGKKVAGILLDISAEAEQVNYAVVGIGINANVDSQAISSKIESKVTSIKDELGREASRLAIVKLLLEKLEFYYGELERHGPAGIIEEWRKNSDMLGRQVSVIQGEKVQTGVAADINEDGSLLLRTGKGDLNIVSGDIRVRY